MATPASSPVPYRLREVRCEGEYVRPVRLTTGVAVRGFHLGPPQYSLDARSVPIRIVGLDDQPAPRGVLVVRSVRPGHIYQMDTRSVARGRFEWPTELIRHPVISLGGNDLAGIFAEGDDAPSPASRLWPLRIGSADPAAGLSLVFQSEADLSALEVGTFRLPGGEAVGSAQKLPRRSFPAEYPVRVPLRVPSPGGYRVTVFATGMDGASAQTDIVLNVPPEAIQSR